MLQEDSDTFEIIDKKDDKTTESASSLSSSISVLPPSGNIFSNVAPPAALPNFVLANPTVVAASPTEPAPFYPTQFSPAIPPSKGVIQMPLDLQQTPQPDIGFMGWMKSRTGLLTKVAEKARNSVESMITTLDPQMREYIYSGGDLDILVASSQQVKVSAIQEAFQVVFGKATVRGVPAKPSNVAEQPVGFAAGIKAAEERIQSVFQNTSVQPTPVVAVENFLLEVGEDKWYDLGVILLNDPVKQIVLQTFTQMTPVPTSVVSLAQEDTPADYPLKWSGYSIGIGSLMGKNLGVSHSEWHHALVGVTRREMILSGAKALATLYKTALAV